MCFGDTKGGGTGYGVASCHYKGPSDEQLTFAANTTFAHICVTLQVFGQVTGSCLSDMIYPIMDANPNLLGCTLDLVHADTDALVSVFSKQGEPEGWNTGHQLHHHPFPRP